MAEVSANTFDRGVDERLLAGNLREQKRAPEPESQPVAEQEDLRADKKQAERAGLKDKLKEKADEMVGAPARQFTNWLLRGSILDMLFTLGLGTFGASLVYVHVHLFGRVVGFKSFFAKLGSEWAPKSLPGGQAAAEQFGAKLFWGEVLLVIIVDLVWAATLLMLFVLFAIVADVAAHPIKHTLSFVWSMSISLWKDLWILIF